MIKRILVTTAAGLALLAASFLYSNADDPVEIVETPVVNALDEYGVQADRYRLVDETIRSGQTFSDLLTPYNISYQKIVELASASKPTFDVRKLKARHSYRVYLDDSLNVPELLVYNRDRTSYVVFDLRDSLFARVENREVTVRTRMITGTINYSLYQTLIDQDASPELANLLSEVFAWQIDFYRIQKGDFFKVIFDELYVGEDRYGIGDIHSARFNHYGSEYYAFHYAEDDVDEYFDETGESLRKAFLIAPVVYSRISSGFSTRRFHPVQKRYKAHLGTDFAAPAGTAIHSTGDGVVTEARYGRSNGNYVKIRHNGTYTTQYLHMSRIAGGIRPGVTVRQGQRIGYVGMTGLANGNHVCYRFWKNGQQVNHRREVFPSVGPVPDGYRARFEEIRDRMLIELNSLSDVPFAPAYAMLFKTPGNSRTGP